MRPAIVARSAGGAEVARFCAKHMVAELMLQPGFCAGDYDRALQDVFHHMDALLQDEGRAAELAAVRSVPGRQGGRSAVRARPQAR